MAHKLAQNGAETPFEVRIFDCLEQFHQNANKSRVDEPVGYIRVEHDRFEVDEHVELVIHGRTCTHFIVNVMQMLFQLGRFNLGCDLFGNPGFKRKRACSEFELSGPLYVFVSDDRLDCCVTVMDQQLVDGF